MRVLGPSVRGARANGSISSATRPSAAGSGQRSGCGRGLRSALRESRAGGWATRGTSSSRGNPSWSSEMTVLSGATSCARRFTRCTSVPTAQMLPGGLCRDLFRMYSVEPLSSAACTTSHGTSGCTITRTPGCSLADERDCCTVKRSCTEQWPFHSNSLAASASSAASPPSNSLRIPDDHLVERHAHLVGRVAAQMLVGQKQDALALLPRPLRGRRPRCRTCRRCRRARRRRL